MAGILKELWTGEVLRKFRSLAGFLNVIPDKSQWVGNDVIHLNQLGADPAVLVDNTVYPINTAGRTDDDVTVTLKKLETENTKVTDDELYAVTYDKIKETTDMHASALIEKAGALSGWSLSPQSDSSDHPVLQVSGNVVDGRKQLTIKDIVMLKKKFDDLKVPKQGRILVLCNDHIADLLLTNQSFERQYMDLREGTILRLHGFEIYEYTENAIYVEATGAKKSFGAVKGDGDVESSFACFAPKMVKAMGSGAGKPMLQMYYRASEQDPENRQTVVGFRTRFLTLPLEDKYYAAIIGSTGVSELI